MSCQFGLGGRPQKSARDPETDVAARSFAGSGEVLLPVLIGVAVSLLLLGCDGRGAGVAHSDGAVDAQIDDGRVDAADGAVPDGGMVVDDEVGWYSQAFEHVGFVSLDDIDPASLTHCSPYIYPLEEGEMWWLHGGEGPQVLPLYPRPDGYEHIGLIRMSGTVGPLGQYGHMGDYDRQLTITEHTLMTCQTVAELDHCVVPRTDDVCVLPEMDPESRSIELWRELPGPASDLEFYTLTITDNEQVLDGMTQFRARFCLPTAADPDVQWEVFELDALTACQTLYLEEERYWHDHQQILYNTDLDGWVMRDIDADRLKISFSATNVTEGRLHLWVDKLVDGEIGYP
jgi:hypothetical protein